MNWQPWLGFAIALFGGGAMGAIIKILYDIRQGRVPTIGERVEIFPLFQDKENSRDFSAVVSVTHNGSTQEYRNLFVADIMVINRSNRDYEDFELGIDLGSDKCVHVTWEDPDQHHALTPMAPISPSSPASRLKFKLSPFNRTNAFSFRLYLSPGGSGREPLLPRLTARQLVRFVRESEDHRILRAKSVLQGLLQGILIAVLAAFAYDFFRLKFPPYAEPQREHEIVEVKLSGRRPFPEHLEQVVPGMHLSEVRKKFPGGSFDGSKYFVYLGSEPFYFAVFDCFSSKSEDPVVNSVAFAFRSEAYRRAARDSALSSYAGFPREGGISSARLEWPNIDNFSLTITDGFYEIRRAKVHG